MSNEFPRRPSSRLTFFMTRSDSRVWSSVMMTTMFGRCEGPDAAVGAPTAPADSAPTASSRAAIDRRGYASQAGRVHAPEGRFFHDDCAVGEIVVIGSGAELRVSGGRPRCRVCVNGGGRAEVPGTWSTTVEWLVEQLAPRFPGLRFGEVRYRVKSWRRIDLCVEDALGAIAALEPERTLMLGFSMGGSVSVRVAAQPSVTGILALAPWLPEQLDLRRSTASDWPSSTAASTAPCRVSPASRRAARGASTSVLSPWESMRRTSSSAAGCTGQPYEVHGDDRWPCRERGHGCPPPRTSSCASRAPVDGCRSARLHVARAAAPAALHVRLPHRDHRPRARTEVGTVQSSRTIHVSVMDGFFLALSVTRQVRFMAKAELYRVPVVKQILHAAGAFPCSAAPTRGGRSPPASRYWSRAPSSACSRRARHSRSEARLQARRCAARARLGRPAHPGRAHRDRAHARATDASHSHAARAHRHRKLDPRRAPGADGGRRDRAHGATSASDRDARRRFAPGFLGHSQPRLRSFPHADATSGRGRRSCRSVNRCDAPLTLERLRGGAGRGRRSTGLSPHGRRRSRTPSCSMSRMPDRRRASKCAAELRARGSTGCPILMLTARHEVADRVGARRRRRRLPREAVRARGVERGACPR